MESIKIPDADKFQLFTERAVADLVYDPGYPGIARADGVLIIQITLGAGRTVEVRKELLERIAERLKDEAGVRPEDVFVSLVEIQKGELVVRRRNRAVRDVAPRAQERERASPCRLVACRRAAAFPVSRTCGLKFQSFAR